MAEKEVYNRNSQGESETLVKHQEDPLPNIKRYTFWNDLRNVHVIRQERKPIIVAVSSRALFNLEEANVVWEDDDKSRQDYINYVRESAKLPNAELPGVGQAFHVVKALENINTELKKIDNNEKELFEVLLISHNCGASFGLVKAALDKHRLSSTVKHIILTDGTSPVEYLKALDVTLFLTLNETDVTDAMKKGIAAQLIEGIQPTEDTQLRIVFESGCIITSDGIPKNEDPLYKVISAIARTQEKLQNHKEEKQTTGLPLRMYLISRQSTEHSATLKALSTWKLHDIHEAMMTTGDYVEKLISGIKPHIIFREKRD